jgi:hypothetical protein
MKPKYGIIDLLLVHSSPRWLQTVHEPLSHFSYLPICLQGGNNSLFQLIQLKGAQISRDSNGEVYKEM